MQTSFHHRLMQTYFALHRKIMNGARATGLTSGQPKILEFLSGREGVEQKTIASSCEIERATAGSLLLRMEQAGLIERRRQNGNRRSLFVYLTEAGRLAARQTAQVFEEAERQAFAGLTEEEIQKTRDLLDRIYDNLCK